MKKKVTEKRENAIIEGRAINLRMSELTSCLIDRKTKETIETEYHRIRSSTSIKAIQSEARWKFDWVKQWNSKHCNSEFYRLVLKSDGMTQGIIEVRAQQGAMEAVLMEAAPHNYGRSGKYIGVGPHMIAIAVKRSYEEGNEGYVYFVAKTGLVEHYRKSLKAEVFRHYRGPGVMMDIKGNAAKNLFDKYFGDKK